MKIALCTTTIHVPHALKLLRKCSSGVKFFIALDKNTKFKDVDWPGMSDANASYLTPDWQEQHWKCSNAIGWNTIARRNIAFLEALKWGADIIYSWDDDNIPMGSAHFSYIEHIIGWKFTGIQIKGLHEAWFDPGKLLIPATRHRGFPHHKSDKGCKVEPVTDAKIGVAAGLVIGDPDIDATTRMEHHPDIGQVHLLGQTGVVVDPHTWTVFNSQNTAVIRELIPAWFMMPHVGRHDDIYASLIVQRVARERDLHVHFGPPFTYQQRNEHNLIHDLRAEIDGMENVTRLAELLDAILLPGKSVLDDTRIIYRALEHCTFLPDEAIYAAHAWLDDVESIL
jgi:hypothetical protein